MFKKLFMSIILVFISMICMAQVYSYRSYAYCQKKTGYSWSSWQSSNLLITINLDTDVIRIYNDINSRFSCYDVKTITNQAGEKEIHCYCIDEEDLKCTVRLVYRHNGTSQIYVDYNNVSWCYNVRRIN